MNLRLLAMSNDCPDLKDCPAIRTDDTTAYITGTLVTDPMLRAHLGIGSGEEAVAVPLSLLNAAVGS